MPIGNTSPTQVSYGHAQVDGKQGASVMIWMNLKPVVLQGNVSYALNIATGKPRTDIVPMMFEEVAEATANGEGEGEPRLHNYVLICIMCELCFNL